LRPDEWLQPFASRMKNESGEVTKGLIQFVEYLILGWHWVGLGALVHTASFMSGQKWF
jgi:hypothetical protein